jgi:hypothetical protein
MPLLQVNRSPESQAVAARAAACFLLGLLATGSTERVLAQTPPLVNSYELVPPITSTDISLTSSLDCGTIRCDIAYRIASRPVDRYVEVVWKDRHGQTLVSASSVNLGFFWGGEVFGPGVVQATQFKKNQNLGGRSVQAQVGTADFTGTGSGNDPCGTGYICKDADYYEYLPSPFSTGPGSGGGGARFAAIGAVELGSITGTLSNVGVDRNDLMPVDPIVEVPFVTFSSAALEDGGAFRYRYTITNYTDLIVPFEWTAAGLSGTLPAFGTAEREIVSPHSPMIGQSLPSWILRTEGTFPTIQEFDATLEVLAPVPEPSTAAMFFVGLGCLLLLGRRRGGS